MLTPVQWAYLVVILLCAFAGGYLPLARPDQARGPQGFPNGEAFSSGVFLALALTMLLPSSFAVFRQVLPDLEYPIASVIAILAFLVLLALEHLMGHLVGHTLSAETSVRIPAIIPLIMASMIAAPSFFLGVALGVSDPLAAALIFVAIVLHKGTAAFALALSMSRSTLSRRQALLLFSLFALSTPLGIVAGGVAREYFTGSALIAKGTVLALGAGTFLYMGTLHEMKHASLIEHCCKPRCFIWMLAGLVITALVRFIVGEAHRL